MNCRSLIGVAVMPRFRQSMSMNDRISQSDPWKCNRDLRENVTLRQVLHVRAFRLKIL